MADTLKFGPQWLRALSDGNSVTSPPPSPGFPATKYKLADHRYGREEMLALFTPSSKIPEDLQGCPSIVSEKPLQALALLPLSEDEQRLMSSSVNSTAVLRIFGRGSGPPIRGGRGGIDRGRGRGRGRGDGFYGRGSSYDDEPGFGRGRAREGSWDDRGTAFDRPFGSRGFDDGQTSPRRDFSRSMSSDNWREAKDEADEGGDWRRAGPRDKWARQSWREAHQERGRGFDRNFDSGHYDDYHGGRRFGRTRSSGSYEDDDLPEWSMPDSEDMDSLGTFDASGAFMSLKDLKDMSDKDKKELEEREEDGKDPDEPKSEPQEKKGKEAVKKDTIAEPQSDRERSKSQSPKPPPIKQSTPPKASSRDSSKSNQREAVVEPVVAAPPPGALAAPPPADQTVIASQDAVDEPQAAGAGPGANLQQQQQRASVSSPQTQPSPQTRQQQPPMNNNEDDQFDHLEKAAEDLVATWTAEEEAKSDSIVNKASVDMGALPVDREEAYKWFYRDPQGELQGPFLSQEMMEWFGAGYFTMSLQVKRGCDGYFQALGDLIKRLGYIPFLPGAATKAPPFLHTPEQQQPHPMHMPKPSTSTPPSSSPSLAAMAGQAPPVAAPMTPAMAAAMPNVPNVPPPQQPAPNLSQQDQVKMVQQQMMFQQQMYLRQLQFQQLFQMLQQQESFKAMPAAQQQNTIFQLYLQQQQQQQQQQAAQQQQQAGMPKGTASPPSNLPQPGQAQPQAHSPPNLSPRSGEAEGHHAGPGGHPAFQRSMSQPGETVVQAFHRTMSQPVLEENWGQQPASVWDIEPPKSQSLEEIQRLEAQRQRQEQEKRQEEERRRLEEEMRLKEEEDRKRKEEEERRKMAEIERQKEMERQRLEQERMEQLRREQEEMQRRQEEERLRRREEERKRREEEERRRIEEEERKERERQELEMKRQEEIMRRQKAEEIRRQQQEALHRLQQEQMANMQLPASAQWGKSGSNMASSAPSLAEIQQLEAERAKKEQEDRKIQMEIQRQQLAAIQQQHQVNSNNWSAKWTPNNQENAGSDNIPAASHSPPVQKAPVSLLEIQQEQAQQLEKKQRQRAKQQAAAQPQAVPLSTAATWNSTTQASNWAAEGAWGRAASQGFWDDAMGASSKKTTINNNAGFPALSTDHMQAQAASSSNKNKGSKSNRDEEAVQRLFKAMKPKDDFTQWCENALKGMQTSVDIPTFVAFLQDVESPYEVHDYVRSYLGETKEANEFSAQFLERRSKFKNQMKQPQQQEMMWGPAPAVNPLEKQQQMMAAANGGDDKNKKKIKKNKMQKIDSSILGFTVLAAPDRMVGEIDKLD